MADGALNLTLSEYASARLAERAKALGITPEDLAADLLHRSLVDDDFADARRGDHISHHNLDEQGRPWSDVRPELLARMKQKLAERT